MYPQTLFYLLYGTDIRVAMLGLGFWRGLLGQNCLGLRILGFRVLDVPAIPNSEILVAELLHFGIV